MPPTSLAKVVILTAAAVGRRYQGWVAGVPMYYFACDAVRLVAGLLCIGLPERVLPKGIPELRARDVVLVSVIVDMVLLNRDDGFSIVDHAGDRRL